MLNKGSAPSERLCYAEQKQSGGLFLVSLRATMLRRLAMWLNLREFFFIKAYVQMAQGVGFVFLLVSVSFFVENLEQFKYKRCYRNNKCSEYTKKHNAFVSCHFRPPNVKFGGSAYHHTVVQI